MAPPEGTFFFQFSDGLTFSVDTNIIRSLRRRYVPEPLSQRMTTLLWVGMAAINSRYGISFEEMLAPIFDLENGTNRSGTKPATMFRRSVLKGLWHKHFFSARFLAANIEAGHGANGLRKIVEDVAGKIDGTMPPTEEMIVEIARRAVHDPLDRRFSTGKATGEWVIFLPRPEGNHYLSVVVHKQPDNEILDQILTTAVYDFPEIAEWIEQARAECGG